MTKTIDLRKNDEFTIWQPGVVEILKSEEDAEGEEGRRIGGYCSTEHLDRQSEVVLQKGLDFSDFIDFGYFNDNHNQATAALVGVPEEAEFHPGKGWYTSGHLLKGFPRSDEIWQLAKSLESTKRRLGFSIEGKVLERKGNHIVRAKIRNVAVTNCPVNPNCTWDLLAKSFDAEEVERAMTVGHDVVPTTGGRVHAPQDLEHDEVKQVWRCEHKGCKKAFRSQKGYDTHVSSSHNATKSIAPTSRFVRKALPLSEAEAVTVLRRLRPHYSEDVCSRIFGFALRGE